MNGILVFGGAGFIGTNLVRELRRRTRREVIVFDRETANEPDQLQGNFFDPTAYVDILRSGRISTVISLIGSSLPGTGRLDHLESEIQRDVIGHQKLLNALTENGIHEFVFFSSGGAIYGSGSTPFAETDAPRPLSVYGFIKATLENLVRLHSHETGLRHLILRPSNPYGEFHRLGQQGLVNVSARKILSHEPITIWGDGSVVRDYIYIQDLVASVGDLLENSTWNDTFNIGSGEGHSVNDVLAVLRGDLGDFAVRYEAGRSVDAAYCVLNPEKLRARTGRNFRTLAEGLKPTLDWIKGTVQHAD